jgi:hypothetical protein
MMTVLFRTLHARFDASPLRGAFTPRKPRNPLVRVLLGLVGVAILSLLLVVGLVVGAAMVSVGLLRAAFRRRPAPARGDVLDAEYRVVTKPGQPVLR